MVLAFSASLRADEGESLDIKTLSGKTYSHCQVVRNYPDGVTFRHSRGMAKVLFTDMTPEGRKHFGYDAAKAEAYERKIQEDRAKAREVTATANAAYQKAWAEAYVSALQAEAIAEALQSNRGGYGGFYGYLNTGLSTNGGWDWDSNGLGFHNNGGTCSNGYTGTARGFRAYTTSGCNTAPLRLTSSSRPLTATGNRTVYHSGSAGRAFR